MPNKTEQSQNEPRIKSSPLPLITGILIFLVVLVLASTMALREQENLRGKIKGECDRLAALIEVDTRGRIPAIQRLIEHWDDMGVMTKDDFEHEMTAFESDVEGFQALEWCDDEGTIRWVVPLKGNEAAVNLNLHGEKNRSATVMKAWATKAPAMSDPIKLVQGGNGFLIIFPVYIRHEPNGYILAVFRNDEWMHYVFSIDKTALKNDDFRIRVLMDGNPFYEQEGWAESMESYDDIASSFWLLNHNLTISIHPTKTFIKRYTTAMPLLMTIFGAMLSILAFGIIGLYNRSVVETWRLHHSQKMLEGEIAERKKTEEKLQHAFSRIDWATKAAKMGVWTWNLATDRLTWNERMFEIFRVPEATIPTYATWKARVHPDDIEKTETLLRDAVAEKTIFDCAFRIILPGGAIRTIRAAARLERDEDGQPKYMNGLNWDITEMVETERALKESETKVRNLLNSTGEAIYGIDLAGNCTFANPSCARLLGYATTEDLLGKNMHELIHHSYPDGTPMKQDECRIYKAFREGRPSHIDVEFFWKADGTSFPVEYWSYPQIVDGKVPGAVVTFVDITERKKAEETIKHMATHDGLTNLPSLLLCRDRLAMAIGQANRDGKKAAVFFIDLDGFKAVNDTFGHDAGDSVLKETARRLCLSVRETDTVARIGGDEFLAVIVDLKDAANAEPIAKKILDAINEPFIVDRSSVRVGASVGIAIFPRGKTDDVESLIKLADQAMYRVKKSGKNGFGFAEG